MSLLRKLRFEFDPERQVWNSTFATDWWLVFSLPVRTGKTLSGVMDVSQNSETGSDSYAVNLTNGQFTVLRRLRNDGYPVDAILRQDKLFLLIEE